jgi:beta-xylosidase
MAACGGKTTSNSLPVNTAAPDVPTNVDPANTSNTNTAPIAGTKIEKEESVTFEGTSLPGGWTFVDNDAKEKPSPYSMADGKFKLTIPGGKDLYADNYGAPHLVKNITGDFQIEARVKFDPKSNYQGAGLIVFNDAKNYIRLERCFGGTGGSGSGVRLDSRKNDEYLPISTPDQAATEAGEVDLKIIRMGKKFIAFWRLNEEGEWKEIGELASDFPDTVRVGLIGVNTSDEITAEFSNVKLMPGTIPAT